MLEVHEAEKGKHIHGGKRPNRGTIGRRERPDGASAEQGVTGFPEPDRVSSLEIALGSFKTDSAQAYPSLIAAIKPPKSPAQCTPTSTQ